VYEVGKEIKTN